MNILFDEQIVKISTDEIITEEEPQIIDLEGRILLPGAIDIHSHLFSKDSAMEADLQKATRSALKGGWTTMAELSFHTESPIFDRPDFRKRIALLEGNIFCDVALWAHVDVTDYPYYAESAQETWNAGAVGIAVFLPSPNDEIEDMSFTEIMELFMDVYESDTEFAFQGFDVENFKSYTFESQAEGIKKVIRRMQENPIHIPRVSSYETIEFINSISKRTDISFAINMIDMMHFLDAENFPAPWATDFKDFHEPLDELLKTNKLYLLSNSCSEVQAKSELFAGNPCELMEYSYLWVLSELWQKHNVPLSTCVKMVSENPAKRLGLYPEKGRIDAGCDADFVIYNPEGSTTVKTPSGKSLKLTGSIESVWLRGKKQDPQMPAEGRFTARTNSPKRRYNRYTWM